MNAKVFHRVAFNTFVTVALQSFASLWPPVGVIALMRSSAPKMRLFASLNLAYVFIAACTITHHSPFWERLATNNTWSLFAIVSSIAVFQEALLRAKASTSIKLKLVDVKRLFALIATDVSAPPFGRRKAGLYPFVRRGLASLTASLGAIDSISSAFKITTARRTFVFEVKPPHKHILALLCFDPHFFEVGKKRMEATAAQSSLFEAMA